MDRPDSEPEQYDDLPYAPEGQWQPNPHPASYDDDDEYYIDRPVHSSRRHVEEYQEDYEQAPSRPRHPKQGARSRRPAAEVEEWVGHPTWQGWLAWYIKWTAIVAVFCVFLIGLDKADVLGTYWVVLGIAVSIIAVLGVGKLIRKATTYKITNHAVYETSGIIRTRSDQAHLYEITNIRIERGLIDRMLGVGTINFDTAGERAETEDILEWKGVRNPYALQQIVNSLRSGETEWRRTAIGPRDEGF